MATDKLTPLRSLRFIAPSGVGGWITKYYEGNVNGSVELSYGRGNLTVDEEKAFWQAKLKAEKGVSHWQAAVAILWKAGFRVMEDAHA